MGKCNSKNSSVDADQTGPAISLAVFGLDNAGKTSTVKGFEGEPLESVAPTVGFSTAEFIYQIRSKTAGPVDSASSANPKARKIRLLDLGGGAKVREIWRHYYAESYGVIFIVDSSDQERLHECSMTFQQLVPHVQGKPVLVLANKQDHDEAMASADVSLALDVEALANEHRCPMKVVPCSAIRRLRGSKLDPALYEGMDWILRQIDFSWEHLHTMVERDVSAQRAAEDEQKRIRWAAIQRRRQEQAEAEEAQGIDEHNDPLLQGGGDPFKRLDYNKLVEKERSLKAQKERAKRQTQLETVAEDDSAIGDSDSRLNRDSTDMLDSAADSTEDKPADDSATSLPVYPPVNSIAPGRLEPIDELANAEKRKRKKKKFLQKHNKTTPSSGMDVDESPADAIQANTRDDLSQAPALLADQLHNETSVSRMDNDDEPSAAPQSRFVKKKRLLNRESSTKSPRTTRSAIGGLMDASELRAAEPNFKNDSIF